MLLLTFVSTAFAVSGKGKHGPKAAPDIDSFPVNPDGTVSVIVQLSPGTPPGQVRKLARLINRNLSGINAVAANVDVGNLDKLLSISWVTYVSPDRANKSAWDDAPQAVNDSIARQNWGVDRTWEPSMDAAKRDELYRNWKRAVERSFGWVEECTPVPA